MLFAGFGRARYCTGMIDPSGGWPGTLRTVEWVQVADAFRRLLVPASLWILLDVALLQMLLRLGAPLSGAHLASFGIASVCLAKPLQDRCFERVEGVSKIRVRAVQRDGKHLRRVMYREISVRASR